MIDVSALAPWTWTDHGAAFVAVGSFVWGVGSALLSPCHLGIIPLLGTHAAGYSPFTPRSGSGRDEAETGGAAPRLHAVRRTLLFTLGCFVTIPLFGLLFALLGHERALVDHSGRRIADLVWGGHVPGSFLRPRRAHMGDAPAATRHR